MADQEFLASYAVEIDEAGVSRLEAVLEENRALAEGLGTAFARAYAEMDGFVREAVGSIPSLERFEAAQGEAVGAAERAAVTIGALTAAYAGLKAAIPMIGGLPEVYRGDGPSERNESGRKSSEFQAYLSDISGSLNRLVTLTAGGDTQTDTGGGSAGTAASAGDTDLSLNLAGASESLQSFLKSLASSEAEIPAALNLTAAEESLSALQTRIGEADAALPLRLDRTRAEASLTDLRRVLAEPVSLSADASAVLSTASAALASIRNIFSSTTLQLKAAVTLTGADLPTTPSDDSGPESPQTETDTSDVTPVRAATGGRYTRPTKVEVAEDGDPEYIIPVEKESIAVPLLRQALADLSASAREAVLGEGSNPALIPDLPETITQEPNLPDAVLSELHIPDIASQSIPLPDLAAPVFAPQQPPQQETVAPAINLPDEVFSELRIPDLSFPIQQLPPIDLSALDALEALAALPSLLTAAVSAASFQPAPATIENRTIEAPVSINVTATGSDAKELGQSIYDSAQRYLQRTLASALS